MRMLRFISEKYKRLMQSDMDNIIFWWSIGALLCGLVMYGVSFLAVELFGLPRLNCGFYSLTGIPCPGCGGSRALLNLIHGRAWTALRYNAFAVYCCVVYTVYFLSNTISRLSGGKYRAMRFRESYMFLGLVILILQYVYKVIHFCSTGRLV